MSAAVVIYGDETKRRSTAVCNAMLQGVTAVGDSVEYRREVFYRGPDADVAVFYGMSGNLRRVFDDYRAAGLVAVYVDLGYWGRRGSGSRYTGFHKVSVNARHPTAYFQRRRHDGSRAAVHNVTLRPWRDAGKHIVLAGMGQKASEFEGYRYEDWERRTLKALQAVTDRPIVFRPKPNCRVAQPIEGTIFSPPTQSIESALVGCHAVVTHHSNVGVDAIVAGVPVFCEEGVATPLALRDLGLIERPITPESREQWVADIAWTQWCLAEMADGAAWRYLKDEGLVPS